MKIPISAPATVKSTVASPSRAPEQTLPAEQVRSFAREACIYAYPLVLMDLTRKVGTNVEAPSGASAPLNQLSHLRAFPDPSFTLVVRPNADTLYSVLSFDVSAEPLVVSVPDSGGRYYLHEWLDGWTDVFSSPGSRTTGTGAQTYAIVGSDWRGTLPSGIREYRSPTSMGLLIGRTQTNGKADYAAVHRFQDGMSAVPLSAYGRPYAPPKGSVDPGRDMRPPPEQIDRLDAATFFGRFTELMRRSPPHANDYPTLDRMRRIGLEPGARFDLARMPSVVREAIEEQYRVAIRMIKERIHQMGTIERGWRINRSGMGTYGTDYLQRAAVAYAGLGANVPQDAIYPTAFEDGEGRPFSSDAAYVVHFEPGQTPPVNAFWSLTMYDERQLFSANPIDRFAIGDRDELRFNEDGSLDLYVQRPSPGPDKESNWLPAPATGTFTMNLRLYWPKLAAIDGTWKPPAVKRMR